MGRVHEQHVAVSGDRRIEPRLQFGVQELPLFANMLGQVFLGGTGIARTRCQRNPRPARNRRTWVGPRRRPVNVAIRSQASATVRTGASVSDVVIAAVWAAKSLTGPVTSHRRRPSNPPARYAATYR